MAVVSLHTHTHTHTCVMVGPVAAIQGGKRILFA